MLALVGPRFHGLLLSLCRNCCDGRVAVEPCSDSGTCDGNQPTADANGIGWSGTDRRHVGGRERSDL